MKLMKNIKAIMAFSLLIVILFFGAAQAEAEVIVIVNKEVPTSSLDSASFKNIYLGKKTSWDKSMKVVLTVLKSGKVHDDFLKKYIGRTAQQFQNYWNKMLFTGEGTPPTSFKSEKELVKYVSKTKGAVGYIDSKTAHDGVNILKIK